MASPKFLYVAMSAVPGATDRPPVCVFERECVCVCARVRVRERERADRQTGRQAGRQADREVSSVPFRDTTPSSSDGYCVAKMSAPVPPIPMCMREGGRCVCV
eukprot:COSAG03_NODE_3670_length_1886_cov_48.607383_3_plen_103_part_00